MDDNRPPRRPPHRDQVPRRPDRGSGQGRDAGGSDDPYARARAAGGAPPREPRGDRERSGPREQGRGDRPHGRSDAPPRERSEFSHGRGDAYSRDRPHGRSDAGGYERRPPRQEHDARPPRRHDEHAPRHARPHPEHGPRRHDEAHSGPRRFQDHPSHDRGHRPHHDEHAAHDAPPPRHRDTELRVYGLNACLAAFARRPHDLRKVWLTESRIHVLREVLAFCVKHRLGYRVVADDDLERLTGSSHHEGVAFDLRRPHPPVLSELLAQTGDEPSLLLWLDGVGNPHNLGAVLRSAAHFGVDALLVPDASGLALSGAACRVAEGGAERVPLLQIAEPQQALEQLRAAGYTIAATLPRDAQSLFDAELPERLVLVFGAEGEGMSRALIDACELKLGIPGTGAVESLNIATAAGVCIAEWVRQRM